MSCQRRSKAARGVDKIVTSLQLGTLMARRAHQAPTLTERAYFTTTSVDSGGGLINLAAVKSPRT
jgi:hypothetical protein